MAKRPNRLCSKSTQSKPAVNLHAAWAGVGRSRYMPHMGNAERARIGLPSAFPKMEYLTAWVGIPIQTRQLQRAAARENAMAEAAQQVFAARHAKRIGRRKARG